MTAQCRKVKLELTTLEGEAALAVLLASTSDKEAWAKFERKRGSVTAGSALGRAISKLTKGVRDA